MKNTAKGFALACVLGASVVATQANAATVTSVALTDGSSSVSIFSGSHDLGMGNLDLTALNSLAFNIFSNASSWVLDIAVNSVAPGVGGDTVNLSWDFAPTVFDLSTFSVAFPTVSDITASTTTDGIFSSTVAPVTNLLALSYDIQLSQSVTPVPLPAAAWLLLSGLGAVGFMRRRAAKQA